MSKNSQKQHEAQLTEWMKERAIGPKVKSRVKSVERSRASHYKEKGIR